MVWCSAGQVPAAPLYTSRLFDAQVAQSVEQRTENPRVGGSIPPLGTIFHLKPAESLEFLAILMVAFSKWYREGTQPPWPRSICQAPSFRRRHGVIWYRLHVPEKLRPLLGWEIKKTLKTTDMDEARRRAPAVVMWAEEKLKAARAQLEASSPPPQAVDLEDLEDAYEQSLDPTWRAWDYALRHDGINLGPEPDQKFRQPFSQTPLAKLLGITRAIEADKTIEKAAAGGPAGEQQEGPAVTLLGLLEAWANEREPPAKTLDAWTRIVDRLIKHVSHEDPERLTRRDVVGWKDGLLEQGLSRKSVEVHLTAVSTIFNHALANERLTRTDCPTKGIRVAKKDDPADKRRPFTEDEAAMVLKAARSETKGSMRWLPVLLAFTGARLDELCGASKGDIRSDATITRELGPEAGWFIRIEPTKDRSVKTGWKGARSVPLHQQVIDEGFLEYVQSLEDGPLFPDLSPDVWGSRAGTATKMLGRRLRALGIIDKRVVAGHSWRHRFKDQCRAAGIPKDQHDALTGHTAGDVGSTYGLGHTLLTLRKAVDKLPHLSVGGATGPGCVKSTPGSGL
jgi:integrase